MNSKQMNFENTVRIAELKPVETLKRIGLEENQVVCDIGAGSGIFTIPAAMITENKVYAVEINDEMLGIIEEKAKNQEITNIELIKVKNYKIGVEDQSVDIVLMVTVLHEIPNKSVFLGEVKQLLNNYGKIAVIEFHKRETPMGPPTEHRMGKIEVVDTMREIGLMALEDFDLGDNFYCVIFGEVSKL